MLSLFVYGTLREPQVLLDLIGRVAASTPGRLHDYERYFDLLPPYAVAMPAPGASIDGQVLEITADELAILDRYEGAEYIRIRVQLEDQREVWLYRGNPETYGDTHSG